MATSPYITLKPSTFPFKEVGTGASKRGVSQVTYAHLITKKIPSSRAPASTQPNFTSASREGIYTASDAAWLTRTAMGILPGMNRPSAVVADQTLSGLSIMNTPAGLIGLHQSTQAFKQAHAMDDADGATIAGIGMVSSTTQAALGTTMVGSRTTSIAAALAPTKTGLVTTAAFFGFLCDILFIPLSALMLGWGAFQSHRAKKFYENWASQNKTFEALVASVYVPKERIDQMIAEDRISLHSSGHKALKKALGDDASETLCMRYCYASSKKKKTFLERALQKHFSKDYPELLEMKEYYFSQLDPKTLENLDLPAAIGLLLGLRKLQLKNQATLERSLGADQLEKIQRAAKRGLEARLKSTGVVATAAQNEWEVLKAGIEASYAKTQFLYKSTALLGLLGLIVSILTFVLTGPFGPAVLLALALVWALASVLHDVYTYEPSGQPGRFDKMYLGVGIALVALSIVATVGAFLFFGGSVLILSLSLALALVLLGMLIHHLSALNQQQKKWDATHTGVQDLISHLNHKKGVDAKARRLFKQLPKDLRKRITDVAAQGKHKELGRYTTMSHKDKEKFHRAVKNSAAFFWKQWWYSNRNNYFKEQAILLDKLALSIQWDRATDEIAPMKHAFMQIRDSNTQDVLLERAHRVFAREESARSLRHAAQRFTAA